jgi:putative DNA primase/helicase
VTIIDGPHDAEPVSLEEFAEAFGIDIAESLDRRQERLKPASGEVKEPPCGWDHEADVATAIAFLADEANWKFTSDGTVSVYNAALRMRDLAISPGMAEEQITEAIPVVGENWDGHYITRKIEHAYRYAKSEVGQHSQALRDHQAEEDRELFMADEVDPSVFESVPKSGQELKFSVWPTPEALPDDLLPVPEFDYDLLPEGFRDYVRDKADKLQVPPEFVAVCLLAAAGNVIGRQCGIRPLDNRDWLEIANLWAAIIGNSATRKTAAMNSATKYTSELERAAEARNEIAEAEFYEELEEWQIRHEAAKKRALQAATKDPEAILDLNVGKKPECPTPACYAVYASSVEKLAETCRDNPRGVMMVRDELGGWLTKMDREDYAEDRNFYVMGWNGQGTYSFDSLKRGRRKVNAVCIGVLGGIQPALIGPYIKQVVRSGGGDGLLARFGLLVWPDVSSVVTLSRSDPDEGAARKVSEIFSYLDNLDAGRLGARTDDAVPYLYFAPDAQEVFMDWFERHETRLRSGSDDDALVSHLIKHSSLVAALSLLFTLVDKGGEAVSLSALNRALAWAEFLEAHARRAYGSATHGSNSAAKRILKKIEMRELTSPFRPRDIYTRKWAGLADTALVKEALDLLEDYGYVRSALQTTGGRPSKTYTSYDALLE